MKQVWNWKNYQIAWQVEEKDNASEIAILFIHGFGACKDHWRFNQKNISSIAPCYAIDLIGFGESSQPISQISYEKKNLKNFNYCFDNWSKQVNDFCQEIIKKPVLLIGNSIGGVIALNSSKHVLLSPPHIPQISYVHNISVLYRNVICADCPKSL